MPCRPAIALFAVAMPVLAAVPAKDLAAFAQRLPALPASTAEAAKTFSYDPARDRARPPESLTALTREIDAAMSASSLPAGMGAATGPGGMSAESAQALAARMETMSEAEKMAVAMQIQQQAMSDASRRTQATRAVDVKSQQQLAQMGVTLNADQQAATALKMKADAFVAAWDAARVPSGEADWHPGDASLCDAKSRELALAPVLAGRSQAESRLREAAAIDREMRQLQTQMLGRVQTIDALSTAAPDNALSHSARERALTNAYLNLRALVDFQGQVGTRAAVWPEREAAIRATPLSANPAGCRHGTG